MDVAYYLSELLGQLGEVNVPGLGYFVQVHIDGYYNEQETAFYPPKNKVQFDPQIIDEKDDTLAQFIAQKKNISLASSRYFTEKYINGLKQEALLRDVPLADLGFLYINGSKVAFKPAEVMANDPAVFGYAPLELNKLGGTSIMDQFESYESTARPPAVPKPEPLRLPAPEQEYLPPPPVSAEAVEPSVAVAPSFIPEPVSAKTEIAPKEDSYVAPVSPDEQEEFVFHGRSYVDENQKSYAWIWITLLALIAFIAIAVFAVYKFRPALYNKLMGAKSVPIILLKKPMHHDTLKTVTPAIKSDTIKDTTKTASGVIVGKTAKTIPATTPVQNQPASGIDSTKVRYEIIGTNASTLKGAEQYIANYKSLGIDAHIAVGAPGKKLKISLGTFNNKAEAIAKRTELINLGKVRTDIYIMQINPKQ